MALHFNIFGAPGSGKSTMRSRLFYELKKKQYKVEEITEHAKDLTYSEDFTSLSDQVLMLGKQHHPHKVLDNQVEYIITDSPFIMGCTYIQEDCTYKDEIISLARAMNESYESINIFLERNHDYQEYGRNQTEEESNVKSEEIKQFLRDSNIDFVTVKSGEKFIKKALKLIKKHNKGN